VTTQDPTTTTTAAAALSPFNPKMLENNCSNYVCEKEWDLRAGCWHYFKGPYDLDCQLFCELGNCR